MLESCNIFKNFLKTNLTSNTLWLLKERNRYKKREKGRMEEWERENKRKRAREWWGEWVRIDRTREGEWLRKKDKLIICQKD